MVVVEVMFNVVQTGEEPVGAREQHVLEQQQGPFAVSPLPEEASLPNGEDRLSAVRESDRPIVVPLHRRGDA